MSYWTEFARSGAPGRGHGGDLPEWVAWDSSNAASPRTLVLDTPEGGGVRMTPITETRDGVLADVDRDPRLATQRDRCRIYRDLAAWGRVLTKQQYPRAGRDGCAAYPFDQYPWGD